LSLYSTFVIEEKYGFNKTTGKIFILDSIKSILLAAIFGGGLLSLIIYIYEQTGSFFWIISWAVFILFTVFISMFYSKLIVPLFNKQKPLEEGEIRNEVIDFAAKVGFIIKNIFVIDGSKRSTKANAYFTGFGRNKRIVLYDNLINDYKTDDEYAAEKDKQNQEETDKKEDTEETNREELERAEAAKKEIEEEEPDLQEPEEEAESQQENKDENKKDDL